MARILAAVVSLHDVRDAELFVHKAIRNSKVGVAQAEYEELFCEAMLIIVDLAGKFVPRMEGYERDGSFAGYCSTYLPKKISAAWHKLHPEHVKSKVNGKMTYVYGQAPASLDEQLDINPNVDSDRLRAVGSFEPPKRVSARPAT